jgi:hypothetical protein
VRREGRLIGEEGKKGEIIHGKVGFVDKRKMRSMTPLAQDEDIIILDAGGRKCSITTARALDVFGETIYFKESKEQDKR